MGQLIRKLEGPISLYIAQQQLTEAHQQLVNCGQTAVSKLKHLSPAKWGSAAKRIRAILPEQRAPLLQDASTDQSLTEVINQCATVERLLDAINWILHTTNNATLVLCHPTTSSGGSGPHDNDLVIQANGEYWCFEISDIANGAEDSNQKELKDLLSLGVVASLRPKKLSEVPHLGRKFLVVSTEFAQRLMEPKRHFLKTGELRYQNFSAGPTTQVLEVLRYRANANHQLELLQPCIEN